MAYKKLRSQALLSSAMETITMMDLRRQPGDILDSVSLGKTFIITKQGKPWALLTQLPGQVLTIVVDKKGNESYAL